MKTNITHKPTKYRIVALEFLPSHDLRKLCSQAGIKRGNKRDMINRLVAANADITIEARLI